MQVYNEEQNFTSLHYKQTQAPEKNLSPSWLRNKMNRVRISFLIKAKFTLIFVGNY